MSVLKMYAECRERFPDIVTKADKFHMQSWHELSETLSFVWFEGLANALNDEMRLEVPVKQHKLLLEFMRSQYMLGDEAQKQCIDVSFVENLFWKVPEQQRIAYWQALPDVLKRLYVKFFGKAAI